MSKSKKKKRVRVIPPIDDIEYYKNIESKKKRPRFNHKFVKNNLNFK